MCIKKLTSIVRVRSFFCLLWKLLLFLHGITGFGSNSGSSGVRRSLHFHEFFFSQLVSYTIRNQVFFVKFQSNYGPRLYHLAEQALGLPSSYRLGKSILPWWNGWCKSVLGRSSLQGLQGKVGREDFFYRLILEYQDTNQITVGLSILKIRI